MNKFDELTTLGLKKRQGFLELRDECNLFAAQLVQGLRGYLGSPIDAVYCVEVDREHQKTGQQLKVPDLCFCYDTFWYFYLGFDFPTTEKMGGMAVPTGYKIGLPVGIKKIGNGFTVKLPARDYQIDNPDQQTDFYEKLYNALKEDLSRPWTQAPKTLGFTMSK